MLEYDNESFTVEAAGGQFRITAETSFARSIAEAQAPRFYRQKQLQFLLGTQKPRVTMRALLLNDCTLFRLPSRLTVALPRAALDATHLFELGINTLIFSAAPGAKEASRLSWNQFYEAMANLRGNGFKIALLVHSGAHFEEMRALRRHFDFMYVEEGSFLDDEGNDLLLHEKRLREIQRLEEEGFPLLYRLKSELHERALSLLSFSCKRDTCIIFDANPGNQPHGFFAALDAASVETRARLIPLFENRGEKNWALLERRLFGAAFLLASLPARGSEAELGLFRACNRMWLR